MQKILLNATLSLALSTCGFAASANETIKKAVEARFDTKVEKITKTEHLGLYEVFADGQQVDPTGAALAVPIQLSGGSLDQFKRYVATGRPAAR